MDQHALRLFGTIHLDRASKVTDELDAYAADVDALFVEVPLEPFDFSVYSRAAVRAPAFVVAMQFYLLILGTLNALVNRIPNSVEAIAIQRVAEKKNLPVHMVDDHPVVLMAEARPWVVAMNWVALLVAVAFVPVSTLLTLAALFGPLLLTRLAPVSTYSSKLMVALTGLWVGVGLVYVTGYLSTLLLAASTVVLLVTMTKTLSDRNEIMLGRVADLSAEHGYDSSCLVTGKGHVSGIIEAANAEKAVDVTRSRISKLFRRSDHERVDPTPDSGDWSDTVSQLGHPTAETRIERAAVGPRAAAAVIDLVIAVVFTLVFVVAGVVIGLTLGDGFIRLGIIGGFLLGAPVYFIGLEALFGRTVGKRLMQIEVRTTDGGRCTFRAALVRNLLRPLDFLFGYALAVVAILLTKRCQRIGDLAAGTVVIQTE